MKKHGNSLLVGVFAIGLTLFGTGIKAFGDTEIDLGDTGKPTPSPAAPVQKAPIATPLPAATPTPASEEIEMEDNTQPTTQTAEEPTPAVIEVHGVVKMKDIYDAGKAAYQEQDYDRAIRYWTKAVGKKDPYTPKFYYAEANAMLGIIYQYHIIHLGRAYRYYKAALKYEPHNQTARRHIKQVYKYRNRKD